MRQLFNTAAYEIIDVLLEVRHPLPAVVTRIVTSSVGPYLYLYQGIVGCTPGPTYPYGKSLYKPYTVGIYVFFHPQESLENTINTMGTRTLGVHPIVP